MAQRSMGRVMAGGGGGGGSASHGAGRCDPERCTCTPMMRKLIVRHPLQQMQALIEQSRARLPAAA